MFLFKLQFALFGVICFPLILDLKVEMCDGLGMKGGEMSGKLTSHWEWSFLWEVNAVLLGAGRPSPSPSPSGLINYTHLIVTSDH